jgi:hypothetical protein
MMCCGPTNTTTTTTTTSLPLPLSPPPSHLISPLLQTTHSRQQQTITLSPQASPFIHIPKIAISVKISSLSHWTCLGFDMLPEIAKGSIPDVARDVSILSAEPVSAFPPSEATTFQRAKIPSAASIKAQIRA